jgi:signal transduction histidine kinase
MSRTLEDGLTPDSLKLAQDVLKEEIELEKAEQKDLHRSRTLELEMRCKDGGTIWVESNTTFLRDENDKAIGILGVSRDITERKEAEGRLFQAQKMEAVGRLAGGVAHDFNNLLTAIIGNLDLLKMDIPEDYLPSEEISEISRAAIRASDLTQQLLAFSRKQIIAPKVIDLNQAINGMDKMLRRLIREDVEISMLLGHDLPAVKADPTQVEQVILNLALNARDAMPCGGKLTIETDSVLLDEEYRQTHPYVEPGPYMALIVTDTGQGMDTETLSHLFEPFYTTKQMGRGTGLGLSTVYGIVKQSGGHITVYSEVGRGTCFKVYIPALGEKAVGTTKVEREAASIAGRGETILVVEDEEAIKGLIKRVLLRGGYDVKIAADCEEAIAIAQDLGKGLDLLLTDVIMPNMQGRDLADVIAGICPHLRTVFMSGYTHNVIAHSGVLDEGVEFISKPFSPDDLLRRIRDVLDS